MNKQIEKLKCAIAADSKSTAILEIQELAFRLEDLSRNIDCAPRPNAEAEAFLESTMRSYWGAMILARKAIEIADQNRQMANANIRHADQVAERLHAERKSNATLKNRLAKAEEEVDGLSA